MESVRIEGPASDVGEALPLGEIKLACTQRIFGAPSVFYVNAGSIPFSDLPRLFTQWHFAMELPAIFSVSPSYTCFGF